MRWALKWGCIGEILMEIIEKCRLYEIGKLSGDNGN